MPEEREWYTVEQIAEMFQVSPETVRRWVRTGRLKVLRLGDGNRSGYRIRREDVRAFLLANYGKEPTP